MKNNTGKNLKYVEINFNLYDEEGIHIGTAFDCTENLLAGDSWKFDTIALGTESGYDVASYKLVKISGY